MIKMNYLGLLSKSEKFYAKMKWTGGQIVNCTEQVIAKTGW